MLIRNLTKNTLKLGSGQDRIVLPPMKVVNVDECRYSPEQLRKHFGHYVQILTEKVEKNEPIVSKPVEEDMGTKEPEANIPPAPEADNKEISGEADESIPTPDTDIVDEGASDNADEPIAEDSDAGLEEVKEEEEISEEPKEEPVEEKKEAPKKSSKKTKKSKK